jgi:hypothetical protein
MKPNKPILSIHIPKTAGISLAQAFIKLFGRENVYFFYENKVFLKPEEGTGEILTQNAAAPDQIKETLLNTSFGRFLALYLRKHLVNPPPLITKFPEHFAVLHGHYRISPNIASEFSLATVFRHPFDRVVSLYQHLHKDHNNGRRIPRWFTPNMPFEVFVSLPQNNNTYTRYLNGLSINDFSYIGTTENLNQYWQLFDPDKIIQLGRANTSPPKNILASSSFINQFERMNQKDYELYFQALAISKSMY